MCLQASQCLADWSPQELYYACQHHSIYEEFELERWLAGLFNFWVESDGRFVNKRKFVPDFFNIVNNEA